MTSKSPLRHLRPALVLTFLLMVITGALYPALVTAGAAMLFPREARGSLIEQNGRTIGSALIGQTFTDSGHFHGRPSAAGTGYDAAASSGANKGPTDRKLADTLIAGAVAQAVAQDGATKGAIPADYVTSSASGLDPDISPATAYLQIARISRVRGVAEAQLRALIDARITARQFGVLGEPRVNVLRLNLALDSLPSATTTTNTRPTSGKGVP